MGLLLGASVVTVFELLDVLIYGFILKIKEKTQSVRQKYRQKRSYSQGQDSGGRSDYFNDMGGSNKTQGQQNMAYSDGFEEYGDLSMYEPYISSYSQN